jgi:hypothetical protein
VKSTFEDSTSVPQRGIFRSPQLRAFYLIVRQRPSTGDAENFAAPGNRPRTQPVLRDGRVCPLAKYSPYVCVTETSVILQLRPRTPAIHSARQEEVVMRLWSTVALFALMSETEPALAGEARHYAAHSRESAEALRELAKIHQNLAKEHARK